MSKEKEARTPHKNAADKGEMQAEAKNVAGSGSQSPMPHNSRREALGPNTRRNFKGT